MLSAGPYRSFWGHPLQWTLHIEPAEEKSRLCGYVKRIPSSSQGHATGRTPRQHTTPAGCPSRDYTQRYTTCRRRINAGSQGARGCTGDWLEMCVMRRLPSAALAAREGAPRSTGLPCCARPVSLSRQRCASVRGCLRDQCVFTCLCV